MNKNPAPRFLSAIIVAVVIFLAGMSFGGYSPSRSNLQEIQNPEQRYASIMIDYGNGKVVTDPRVALEGTTTVFDILKKVTDEKSIELVSMDYGGELGVFIESIGGIGKDPLRQKWWQYWVNNEYSQSGVSGVIVHPGDAIEFKFIMGQQ